MYAHSLKEDLVLSGLELIESKLFLSISSVQPGRIVELRITEETLFGLGKVLKSESLFFSFAILLLEICPLLEATLNHLTFYSAI